MRTKKFEYIYEAFAYMLSLVFAVGCLTIAISLVI